MLSRYWQFCLFQCKTQKSTLSLITQVPGQYISAPWIERLASIQALQGELFIEVNYWLSVSVLIIYKECSILYKTYFCEHSKNKYLAVSLLTISKTALPESTLSACPFSQGHNNICPYCWLALVCCCFLLVIRLMHPGLAVSLQENCEFLVVSYLLLGSCSDG